LTLSCPRMTFLSDIVFLQCHGRSMSMMFFKTLQLLSFLFTTYLLLHFDNGRTSRIRVSILITSQTFFIVHGILFDSVGKIFIGLLLNVLLFGINVTQTYFYYIHSKKCVSMPETAFKVLFVYVSSEIDCRPKYGWANDACICLLTDSKLAFYEQVVVVFIADFLQPLFCSIYLYRTLIVHFGMRCYFSERQRASS
jgi:hypothetical protein